MWPISRHSVSLASGSRLGAYEVINLLGAGGMGEVHRARDTKLTRDVAVKILPGPFALDTDRLARFKREAQVLADTLAEVLKGEPDWRALPTTTPEPVRRLLRRCLAKDRKTRLPDIAVARLEIDEAPAFSVADGGVLTYRASGAGGVSQLEWVDRTGKQTGVVGDQGAVSPDGQRFLVDNVVAQPGSESIAVILGWSTELKK